VGFVHSKFLKKPGIKMNNMIHVSDWLPTLYSAAGGQPSDLGQIDGHDLWDMIQTNGSNVRTELLHNIDPVSKFSAVRVGNFKLIQGHIPHADWYPCNPPKETNNNTVNGYRQKRSASLPRNDNLVVEYDTYRPLGKTDGTPYKVECGERPKDYKTNCKPEKAPCLYNIVTDPCEYNNTADLYPSIVQKLQQRIEDLSKTAVNPVNKPGDKNANPALHGGVWVPWQGSEGP